MPSTIGKIYLNMRGKRTDILFLLTSLLVCMVSGQLPTEPELTLPDWFHAIESPTTRSHLHRSFTLLNSGRCKHIYLDLGTNVGVQIRKLYEPHLFPGSPVLPIFQKLYNRNEEEGQGFVRTNVCTFGFEANPQWTSELQAIESEYTKRGFPVVMFTETAVHSHGRNISFFMEPAEDVINREWGASLNAWHDNMTAVTVGALPFHQFMQWVVANCKGASLDSRMAAKMDVEGAEYILLPNLMLTGMLCFFDIFMAEFHPYSVDNEPPPDEKSFVASIEWILRHSENCKVHFLVGGDETYAFTNIPVSTCVIPHNVYASEFSDDILSNYTQYYIAALNSYGILSHLTYGYNITFPAYAIPNKAQLRSVKMVDIYQNGLTHLNDKILALDKLAAGNTQETMYQWATDDDNVLLYYEKVEALVSLADDARVSTICEISQFKGFSSLIFLAANAQARLVSFGTYSASKDTYALRSIREMYSHRDVLFLMANTTAEIQPMSQFLKDSQSLCNLLYVGIDQLTDLPVMMSQIFPILNASFHTIVIDGINDRAQWDEYIGAGDRYTPDESAVFYPTSILSSRKFQCLTWESDGTLGCGYSFDFHESTCSLQLDKGYMGIGKVAKYAGDPPQPI